MITSQKDPSGGVVIKECYKLCPSCSHFVHVTEKDTFCVMCGEKLIEKCPRCHEPIVYPLSKFCPVCGDQLTGFSAVRH